MERALSLVGLFALVGVAWLMSNNRKAVKWRPVIWGVGLQLIIGLIILMPSVGQDVFDWIDVGVKKLLSFSEAGSDFLFQTVEEHQVTTIVDGEPHTEAYVGRISPPSKTLAFWILPTVIFFSALMALLYHYQVMQYIVRFFSRIMQRTMGTSGAESLSAASNIFVGQTEAPLVVRPFVDNMTMSELNAVMVGGFATVAGGVLALYVGMLHMIPGIAGHLVTASIMSAPAALAIAKVMVPETGQPVTMGRTEIVLPKQDVNGLDALSRGTLEGLKLCLNIAAMLLVFIAVIAMVNAILGAIFGVFGIEGISIERTLGWIFAPLAFLMGIPWEEAQTVGMLLGEKIVLTELIAFVHLGQIQASELALSPRSAVIASYALAGFANFASIGIQIGGIGGIAPKRQKDLARLGFRAMIGGAIAAMMTGTVAGLMYVEG